MSSFDDKMYIVHEWNETRIYGKVDLSVRNLIPNPFTSIVLIPIIKNFVFHLGDKLRHKYTLGS